MRTFALLCYNRSEGDIMKGKFVTFEGCEGVGKSTQLKQLKEYLDKTGQPAIFTREPGGNKISEQIRSVILNPENTEMNAMCEALLYAASRAQLVDEVIKPALDKGELVICDRFLDSSIAYQGGARGLGIENVLEINRHAIQGCMPDLTVFLDLSPEHSFRSRQKSAELHDRLEDEAMDFHLKVYEGYLEDAEMSEGRIVKIVPCQNKKDTTEKIIELLREKGIIR